MVMLVLVPTGLLEWLERFGPNCLVLGIQLKAGLQLSSVHWEDSFRPTAPPVIY